MASESQGLTRRTLVKGGIATGVGLALTACGGQGGGSSAKAAQQALKVGVKATIETLTPIATQGYQWGQAIVFAMYEPLVRRDSEGALVPVLAESVDQSDPNQMVIKIRQGVTFHNGEKMTAEDVAYSIAVRSDPALIERTGARPVMTPEQFKSVEAVDAQTVLVKTNGRSDWIYNANQPVVVIRNESASGAAYAREANGTGPFKLRQFLSGSRIETVAFESYWGGKPAVAELSFNLFSDMATLAANLRSGQINALHDIQPLAMSQVEKIPGYEHQAFGTYVNFWMPQMGKAPLDNADVRAALRYCFDKELLNKASFRSLGKATWNPFNVSPIAGSIDAPNVYDPERARALLKNAGVDKIAVPLLGLEGYADCEAQAQIIQQGLKAAGVDSTYEALPFSQWLDKTYTNATWEGLAFNAGSMHYPYKVYFDSVVVPSALTSAYSDNPNPAVAGLYKKIMASEVGSDEERALIDQGQQLIVDEMPVYFMFGGPSSLVLPQGLKGVETNGWGDVFWSGIAF